jgi:hypothetical protein
MKKQDFKPTFLGETYGSKNFNKRLKDTIWELLHIGDPNYELNLTPVFYLWDIGIGRTKRFNGYGILLDIDVNGVTKNWYIAIDAYRYDLLGDVLSDDSNTVTRETTEKQLIIEVLEHYEHELNELLITEI